MIRVMAFETDMEGPLLMAHALRRIFQHRRLHAGCLYSADYEGLRARGLVVGEPQTKTRDCAYLGGDAAATNNTCWIVASAM